jgi:hydroxypyruvate reductase
MSLEAAAKCAREAGVTPIILGDAIEGEAREIGRQHGALALRQAQEAQRPFVFLSGGETSVTMRAPDNATSRGGRNSEYLLALALALEGAPGVYALAADTDGIDGMSEHAGATIAPDTLARALAAGLDPGAMLELNNSGALFEALGDCVTTGATLTNVNDFRATLIL